MTTAGTPRQKNEARIVSELIEIGSLDTVYRDLYLQSARSFMEPILSHDSYSYVKDSVRSLDSVERQLRAAVQRADWKRTTELTERLKAIKKSAEQGEEFTLAEAVYDKAAEVAIDPFASGFYAFLGHSPDRLKAMKSRAIEILSTLGNSDSAHKTFYSKRRADFEGLTVSEEFEEKKEEVSAVDLRQAALNAVDSGDLAALESAIEKINKESARSEESTSGGEVSIGEVKELGDDLNYSFSAETLAAAGELGLSNVRTRSRREFAHLEPYGWSAAYLKSESKRWAKDQVSRLSYPSQAHNPAREAIELYLFNPLINSGGTRYSVCLVEEDLLVEDFEEPEPRAAMPVTALLRALNLSGRWGHTRLELEEALLRHGPRVLKEKLHLDPEAFRLVAIPPDIFSVLGSERNWGQHDMWTHFDGYWIQEGCNLQALAGGDKRFGGIHDVVCFSPTYTTDKLLTRFAVVQRKRMMSWQRG